MSAAKEATALQRKIFSRWVNQKIQAKGKKINDVCEDFKGGEALIWLLEVLSEKEFANWKKIQVGSRMKQIDACGQALAFMRECGVEMKQPPSPENLVDGAELPVMGLIWAIMLKYMKLDDGEEDEKPMSFADALKMWIANQVQSYGLSVDNMTKSFHDGRVFCALVNKFRPKLLDYSKISNPEANLKMAFTAAEKYFGLEQYLQWTDIAKLDDKSMVVYASEYYYGIAQQRKVDLACKRVVKLIEYTKENDRLKEDYTARASVLRARLEKVLPVLGDTTIENTMAGAVRRLEIFNKYRKEDKSFIFGEAFTLDSMYQNLARRLHSHKRPAFVPKAGCSVPDIMATVKEIEKREASQNVALHNELNRQIKLAKIFEQFTAKYKTLNAWIAEKKSYLEKKLDILSVGEANFALNQLQAYNTAYAAQAATLPAMKQMQDELVSNKFEHTPTVEQYAKEISSGMADLEAKAAHKKLVHEDDLAREILKAKIRGRNDDHIAAHTQLDKNAKESIAALSKKEVINSIKEAEYHLAVTHEIHQRRADNQLNVAPLKAIGVEIVSAEHKGQFSHWKFEHPEEVHGREAAIDKDFAHSEALGKEKLLVLDDDLKREFFKEDVRQMNETHKLQNTTLVEWTVKSKAYLDVKEPVDSVEKAQDNLIVIRSYMESQNLMQNGAVKALQELGKKILTAKYQTKYSEWHFPTPQEVQDREGHILSTFAALDAQSKKKHAVLEDDLKREQFKFKLGLKDDMHKNNHQQIRAWVDNRMAYLKVVEPFDSIADAEKNLKTIANYVTEKENTTKITVAAFNKLGHEILTAEYKTDLSSWKWEHPQVVQGRLDGVVKDWADLDSAYATKKAKLDADLVKEKRKEELRVLWAKASGEFADQTRDVLASAPNTLFGFVLEEVEAFAATLKTMDAKINADGQALKARYDPVWAEMLQLGVRTAENPYSKLTPDDMARCHSDIQAALKAREQRFHTELEKQRADDKACRDLAGAADPFVKEIAGNTQRIADCKEDLDPFLALVVSLSSKPTKDQLTTIVALQKVVDDRKIIYNRHTLNNGGDCGVQFTQYTDYTTTKQEMLRNDIEYRNLRGLTKETYAEIKQQFDQFDKDKSGFLDKREFRSCLYSVGEERGKKEIDAILVKLGNGDPNKIKISYDGFKEFMIEQLGDTDTAEEVIKGFKLMNRQEAKCQWKIMENIMDQPYIDYIKKTHNDDYTGWVQSVFAR